MMGRKGKGDLAVMSMEAYEELTARFELFFLVHYVQEDVEKYGK